MSVFTRRNGQLHAEAVDLAAIAQVYGTPCYVYSRQAVESAFDAYTQAFASRRHLICYAIKANSSLGLLHLLARRGAGFDIVSAGELTRVLRAGGAANKVVFSGVGKRADEMALALEAGIRCFNVESVAELARLNQVAAGRGQRAPVSLRVNPDVDAQTHPYISTGLKENKFGIDIALAESVYREAAQMPGIEVVGLDCHIGSQLLNLTPYRDALSRLLSLVDRLLAAGMPLKHLDLGGGLGIRYKEGDAPPTPAALADIVLPMIGDRPLEIFLEPGRSIVGAAGALLTRVEYLKSNEQKHFAIVDAAMNDLLRPALYGAWQEITPVTPRQDVPVQSYDIVGPVCETGDFLGKARPLALTEGDLLAVLGAGAYGYVMASNYNTRPRPPEVLVDGNTHQLLRPRETLDDLLRNERLPA